MKHYSLQDRVDFLQDFLYWYQYRAIMPFKVRDFSTSLVDDYKFAPFAEWNCKVFMFRTKQDREHFMEFNSTAVAVALPKKLTQTIIRSKAEKRKFI